MTAGAWISNCSKATPEMDNATLNAPSDFFAMSISVVRAGMYERSATSFMPASLA